MDSTAAASPAHATGAGAADHAVLRRAEAADSEAAAEVWLRSYGAALPSVRRAHSDEAVREWFRRVVVPDHETWVAVAGDAVVGVLVLTGERELDQLYLDPRWRGRGLGDRFMELAKRRRPAGLELWTFQVNVPAQRFYERHGFTEVLRTDGHGNEEREPDIRYAWRPEESAPTS
ncbi:GNAT family N-acetyltransferase [Streptomyces sp. LX-29]|uniref:GNAT family N-acetyltransferase n=1 Tax=Streptomyces sp. LX-29 TaxID=2900152 RepID=UPI00240DB658|nr:GNAT family N-acetyltransferase [Streptomyces sp. LX-29]WFB11499.1 GNAT family N-acetyltransferase [Streptomyces sp. LX-29]